MIPPPLPSVAVFPLTVEFVSDIVPWLIIPPPPSLPVAVLPLTVEFKSVAVPEKL